MTTDETTPPSEDSAEAERDAALGRRAARLRLGGLALLLIIASFAAARWGVEAPDRLRDAIDRSGPFGPAVFVAAYALLTVALFPGSVVSAIAGLLFGPVLGTILTVIGATIGSTGSFLIGRRLGRSSVERLVGGGVARVDDFIADRPLRSMLALRLTPIFPFGLVNYAAGLTRVPLRDYVVGTAIGIIPGTFAFVALGSSLEDPGSPRFLASVAFLIALTVAGWLVLRVGRNRDGAATEAAAEEDQTLQHRGGDDGAENPRQ